MVYCGDLEIFLGATRPRKSRRLVVAMRLSNACCVASESYDTPERLTKRELDVLRLIAGGYSNREISAALGTVEGTVKNHASSILAKLGVRDRTRAVLKALELGVL